MVRDIIVPFGHERSAFGLAPFFHFCKRVFEFLSSYVSRVCSEHSTPSVEGGYAQGRFTGTSRRITSDRTLDSRRAREAARSPFAVRARSGSLLTQRSSVSRPSDATGQTRRSLLPPSCRVVYTDMSAPVRTLMTIDRGSRTSSAKLVEVAGRLQARARARFVA
jgi:hypothetical protein